MMRCAPAATAGAAKAPIMRSRSAATAGSAGPRSDAGAEEYINTGVAPRFSVSHRGVRVEGGGVLDGARVEPVRRKPLHGVLDLAQRGLRAATGEDGCRSRRCRDRRAMLPVGLAVVQDLAERTGQPGASR